MGFKNIKTTKIVVDFSNAVYRAVYATLEEDMINANGINVGFILGYAKLLAHAISKCNEESSMPELVICEDRKPTRKRNLYRKYWKALADYNSDKTWDGEDEKERIRYKGNREKTDLDYDPISICQEFNSAISCERIWCEGEEADDVIASYINQHPGDRIIVYSTDKDLWQLLPIHNNINIILGDGSSPGPEACNKHFNTTDFSKIPLHKMIRGDSGDNVKPVNRFQFKKTIQAYKDCNGTIEDYLRLLIDYFGENSNYMQRFWKYLDVVRLNYDLVKLVIELDLEKEIYKGDIDKWNDLCDKYQTPSLLDSPLVKIY